jgi:adenine-specific DNA-methyltransferase
MDSPHVGSDFDEFLKEEGIHEEVTAAAIKRVIDWQLGKLMKSKHITKTEMDSRMRTSQAMVNRLLQEGAKEVVSLFEEKGHFDGPKTKRLLCPLLTLANTIPNDLILDFFAGSATTTHAVMQFNAEDKGNCKFIMVQLPESCDKKSEASKSGYKTIAEIAKERIRRAAAKIKKEHPEYNGDLGFKVFKLDSTNIKPWEADFETLDENLLEDYITNIKPGRTESDILYEILLKYGLDLTLPIKEHTIAGQKVFDIGMGALIICLSDAVDLEVVEGIAGLKEELKPEIMRVVFKDSGFKDDVVKTNAVQILKQAGIEDVRSL